MPDPIPLILLVGGQGTRIRHLFPETPKPLIPIAGKPWLYWVLQYFAGQGIGKFILSSGYRAEQMDGFIAALPAFAGVLSSVTETTPLGTAGGFINAVQTAALKADYYLVANGDSLVLTDLRRFLSDMIAAGVDAAILGLRVEDASRFGTLALNAAGELAGFAEKKPGAGLINGGVYLLKQEVLAGLPPTRPLSFEYDVIPKLLAEHKRIGVVAVDAPFIDIGTESSLQDADSFIEVNRRWFNDLSRL